MSTRRVCIAALALFLAVSLLAAPGGVRATSYVSPHRVPAQIAQIEWPGTNPNPTAGGLYDSTAGKFAPFVVQVDVYSDAAAVMYAWFADPDGGQAFETWDRFDGSPTWLAESESGTSIPAGLNGVSLGANSETRIMTVGRVDGDQPTLGAVSFLWCMDQSDPADGDCSDAGDETGSFSWSPSFATTVDWYQNPSVPQENREMAFWVTLTGGGAQATAPVDASGFFALPVNNGCTAATPVKVTANSEADFSPYSWTFAPLSCGGAGGDGTTIDVGVGAPTAVTLAGLSASADGSGWSLPALLGLAALALAFSSLLIGLRLGKKNAFI